MSRPLILASSSPYRFELMRRLQVPFTAVPHRIDEGAVPHEAPHTLVATLAKLKAVSLREAHPTAIIIGSDQGVVDGDELIGKPSTFEKAHAQLTRFAGGTYELVTAVTVLEASTGQLETSTEIVYLTYRSLTSDQITKYLELDQPFDCAGSFKLESLGVSLFSSIETTDPTAIMGLPLIKLIDLLKQFGISPL